MIWAIDNDDDENSLLNALLAPPEGAGQTAYRLVSTTIFAWI